MELTDYWRIIRAHWLAIIIFTIIGGGVAFGSALIQPKVYTANASGIVSAGVSEDLGSALVGDNYAKSRVKSYLDIATSRAVASFAIEELGLDASAESLVSKISVQNPLDTAVMKVTAEASTPGDARALAEAWVHGISQQVSALENSNAEGGTSIVAFTTLDSAVLPTEPSSPNTRLFIAVGLLIGFIAGIAFALIRNVFDRRIRSTAQVEEDFGVPVVGTIPFDKNFTDDDRLTASQGGNDARTHDSYDYAVAESMRELRTNLQFMSVDDPPRVIVVTSSLPGEGKSTITANLATTIAASGQRVVVIDGDLRRPTVAKAFGLLPGVGLTDVLIGRAELEHVLQPWGDTGMLYVLGAGAIPPNPSELLGSHAMEAVLKQLSKHATVLIDAPPLIPVTDAAVLAARTDGALVVAYARRTTVDALGKAMQNLERVKGRALGVILNGVPRKGADANSYGYQYKSYYGSAMPEAEPVIPTAETLLTFDDSALAAVDSRTDRREGRRAAS